MKSETKGEGWEDDHEADDEVEDEYDDEEPPTAYGTEACMCKMSPTDHPGGKWTINAKGYKALVDFQRETDSRDQDFFDSADMATRKS